ncbi:hypothetical protein ALC53_06144 [Atta colombica]|uniref:Uncharacterized protein n=1 Tax=Atta colombica TaxID=520822 RepID=A0A195BGY6_9HYME|nr:hypothetical protein ALC53_06144 [Atta colombica]
MISALDDATALGGIDRITGLPPRRITEMFISKNFVLFASWVTSGSACNLKTCDLARVRHIRTIVIPSERSDSSAGRLSTSGRRRVAAIPIRGIRRSIRTRMSIWDPPTCMFCLKFLD